MSLFKPSGSRRDPEAGMSLLQGLAILAIIGIVAAIVLNQFVG